MVPLHIVNGEILFVNALQIRYIFLPLSPWQRDH